MKNDMAILIANMKQPMHTIKFITNAILGYRAMQSPTWVRSIPYIASYCTYENKLNRVIGEQRSHLNQLDNIMHA